MPDTNGWSPREAEYAERVIAYRTEFGIAPPSLEQWVWIMRRYRGSCRISKFLVTSTRGLVPPMLDLLVWECTECHALYRQQTNKKKGRYVLSRPCICCPKGRMVHRTMTVADRIVPRRPPYDQDDELSSHDDAVLKT